MNSSNRQDHIRLTSHPDPGAKLRFPDPLGRGDARASAARSSARCRSPACATSSAATAAPMRSTARSRSRPARSIRSGGPTSPTRIRPRRSARSRNGASPERIVSLDPWGHLVAEAFRPEIAEGIDIRPSIAITRARLDLPEMRDALAAGRLKADGTCRARQRQPVGGQDRDRSGLVSARHRRSASARPRRSLRRTLFEQTAGMFPELVTRPDLRVFLPPIGGTTVYLFGDVAKLADPRTQITCRVHDECNGSDVFGSDICTCRPYLIHGIEECARAAQAGRARHHRLQPQGRPRARRGHQVPGLQRAQAPGGRRRRGDLFRAHRMRRRRAGRALPAADAGRACIGSAFARIDRFVSMSDMKYDALVGPGHRDRRARADSRRAGAGRRACRDRGQEGRRLLHAAAAEARGPDRHVRPVARKVLIRAVTRRPPQFRF